MRLLTLLLLTILLIMGCKSPPTVARADTVERIVIKERVRDSIVKIPADSSALTALIECRDGQARLVQILNYRPGQTVQPPQVVIRDNYLTAKCIVDSSSIYLQWKERDTTRVSATSTTIVERVNYVTSWQTAQLWLGRLMMALVLIYIAVKLVRRYTGVKL